MNYVRTATGDASTKSEHHILQTTAAVENHLRIIWRKIINDTGSKNFLEKNFADGSRFLFNQRSRSTVAELPSLNNEAINVPQPGGGV